MESLINYLPYTSTYIDGLTIDHSFIVGTSSDYHKRVLSRNARNKFVFIVGIASFLEKYGTQKFIEELHTINARMNLGMIIIVAKPRLPKFTFGIDFAEPGFTDVSWMKRLSDAVKSSDKVRSAKFRDPTDHSKLAITPKDHLSAFSKKYAESLGVPLSDAEDAIRIAREAQSLRDMEEVMKKSLDNNPLFGDPSTWTV